MTTAATLRMLATFFDKWAREGTCLILVGYALPLSAFHSSFALSESLPKLTLIDHHLFRLL